MKSLKDKMCNYILSIDDSVGEYIAIFILAFWNASLVMLICCLTR